MDNKRSDGRAVHPLPHGGGEGRDEGVTAASRRVLVDPLTLTLSPSEGERETNASVCRPSHGFLSKERIPFQGLSTSKSASCWCDEFEWSATGRHYAC